MKKYTQLAVVLGVLMSGSSYAANMVADARGNAMGNTGVTTSNYLLAPFYNPALTAVYQSRDDFGVLLPAVGINLRDSDDNLSTIDDLQDTIKAFEAGDISPANQARLSRYLDELSTNKPFAVSGGLGVAVAIPMNKISLNFFSRGYVEIQADAQISQDADIEDRYQNSAVDLMAFGYSEYGLALAKTITSRGHHWAVGISPKVQQLKTYHQTFSVQDFDLDDYDQSEVSKSAFNLDLGVVYFKDNYRAGIAVKDLFSQTIATFNDQSHYKLDTQVTISGGYVSDFFTAAIDMDVTKQSRFEGKIDDTQFLRFGVEGNAWGWAQLRAGYEVDLQDNLDNTVTAGIGFSPFSVVRFDLAGNYAGKNQLGAAANISFTF
ncbi:MULTISPECIES: conjugal transfer protein TraF [Vibrio]|uniref:conjugal transfer protein TraF n=1 Tax=Vibrio TaxID=662 RepID=UPI000C16FF38|nr:MULTISPECIES: conjugal transfer protein TraF [Vibrio]NNN44894.1 conjugal transfer protein TraF [Vibrio sp. 1-1(7)]NNN72267.1 conjugal transfer protein TraF [Vibrio sp. 12-2(3-a)]